jgi:hypothetical protein
MTYSTEEAIRRGPVVVHKSSERGAQLDGAHVGDIRGGFGTIRQDDTGPRTGWGKHRRLSAL